MQPLLLLLLAACFSFDRDRDGIAWPDDCDDDDASVLPGAPETCDGLDQDCDGSVDEGEPADAPTWFPDADADAWGAVVGAVRACVQPDGWVPDTGDCDDTDPTRSPVAEERCNGVDDDCNGTVDDDYAFDAPAWHEDADGDGAGNPVATIRACGQPAGAVDDASDCDDADPGVFPEAAETLDGVDQDCDGALEHLPFTALRPVLTGVLAGDRVGLVLAAAGDVYDDGIDDLLVGAPDDGTGATGAGGAWVLAGPLTGIVQADATTARIRGEEAGDGTGYALAGVGDVDGDGVDDVAVGAPADGTPDGAGAVGLFLGPVTGTRTLRDAAVYLTSPTAGDLLGAALAPAGDLDGDGWDDWFAAAPGAVASDGRVWLFQGPLGSPGITPDEAAAALEGRGGQGAGRSLAGGRDVDGDGIPDTLVVSSRGGEAYPEAAWLVRGATLRGTAGLALQDADLAIIAIGSDGGARTAVDLGADVDGDGLGDLLVADAGERGGTAWLLPGSASGLSGSVSLGEFPVRLEGASVGDALGTSAILPGDLDGDGYAEVVAGAPARDGGAGQVRVAWGPLDGIVPPEETSLLDGGTAGDGLGTAATALDADGDGRPDLLLGAPGWAGPAREAGFVGWARGD